MPVKGHSDGPGADPEEEGLGGLGGGLKPPPPPEETGKKEEASGDRMLEW